MCGFTYPAEENQKHDDGGIDESWALPWHQDPNRDYFADVENRKNKEPSIYDGPPC